jgi:hypothetical protein
MFFGFLNSGKIFRRDGFFGKKCLTFRFALQRRSVGLRRVASAVGDGVYRCTSITLVRLPRSIPRADVCPCAAYSVCMGTSRCVCVQSALVGGASRGKKKRSPDQTQSVRQRERERERGETRRTARGPAHRGPGRLCPGK